MKTVTINGQDTVKKAVTIYELMAMLSCSRRVAEDIGKAANARIEISPRKILWNIDKIDSYMDSISE